MCLVINKNLRYILQLLNYCFPVFVKGGEYDNIEALLRQLVNSVGSYHLRLYINEVLFYKVLI